VNRLSFSRQPSVWIGLISAGVAFAAVLGLHAPQGFEAAAAGVVTAVGAAFTWTQVRPAATSIEVKPGADVIVHEKSEPGVTKVTEHALMNGKVAQIGAASTIRDPFVSPAPIKAHPKKATTAKKKPTKKGAR
jgi:hypothetical protein